MRKIAFATAALLALAMPVKADVVGNFGVNPTSAAGAFSNDPLGAGIGGMFNDQYLFTLNGTSFVTIATASNTFAVGGIDGPFGINPFAAAIFDTVDGVPNNGNDVSVFGPAFATLCASGLCQELSGNGILPGGSYYLSIQGIAGTLAGYGGNFSVAELSQVPLPPAIWLFLTGIVALFGASGREKIRAFFARIKMKIAQPLAA